MRYKNTFSNETLVITLTLLHPLKSIPVQKWNFEPDTIIKIGRANDNNVILYSAVVSRHHLEIRPKDSDWVLINRGSNGTFVNGKKVNKVLVRDGMVFRLASSGPKIRIKLQRDELEISEEIEHPPKTQPISNQAISQETVMNSDE